MLPDEAILVTVSHDSDSASSAPTRCCLVAIVEPSATSVVEFSAAISIASVSLFADSIDFLEDTSVNLLILLALGWSLQARSR